MHCVLVLKAFWMLLPTLGYGFFSGLVNALLDFVHLTGTDRFSSVFLKFYYFFLITSIDMCVITHLSDADVAGG